MMWVMRKYPAENWLRLGEWIHDARIQAGYADTRAWADKVGRSTRQLLGLERGEPVGPKTLERVATVLGVGAWMLFAQLIGEDEVTLVGSPEVEVARVKQLWEDETGSPVAQSMEPADLLVQIDPDKLLELSRMLLEAAASARAGRDAEVSVEEWPTEMQDALLAFMKARGSTVRPRRATPRPVPTSQESAETPLRARRRSVE